MLMYFGVNTNNENYGLSHAAHAMSAVMYQSVAAAPMSTMSATMLMLRHDLHLFEVTHQHEAD